MKRNRKQSFPQHPSSEAGFTLVEILVVLVIIGLLGAFLFGNIFGSGEKAKARMTELKMKTLSQKIGEYKLAYNALPGTLQDLTVCNDVTGPGCIPLVDANDKDDLVDAWGNGFLYQADGNRTFRITSLGADGKPGGQGVDFDFNLEGP
ncbi:MAG: type II secretion system protein GspG [Bdellovibrionales bacterium]|nr:type II secretion system protein GspG [Bdellovibrionales bacterium]